MAAPGSPSNSFLTEAAEHAGPQHLHRDDAHLELMRFGQACIAQLCRAGGKQPTEPPRQVSVSQHAQVELTGGNQGQCLVEVVVRGEAHKTDQALVACLDEFPVDLHALLDGHLLDARRAVNQNGVDVVRLAVPRGSSRLAGPLPPCPPS